MTNLIDEIVSKLETFTDIPPSFIRAAAYTIIAETIGSKAYYVDTPTGMRRPNTYFIGCADPSYGRKSTTEGIVRDILRGVFVQSNLERVKLKEEKPESEKEETVEFEVDEESETDRKVVYLQKKFDEHTLESGSEQGLVDKIVRTKGTAYLIMGSEYGDILRKITDPTSYLYGMLKLMDKCYYGESYDQALSERVKGVKPRYIPPGKYVNGLMFTQDVRHWLNSFHITQGFLRRCILVVVLTKDLNPNRHKAPTSDGQEDFKSRVVPDLIAKLADFSRSIQGRINIVTGPVQPEINKLSETTYRQGIEDAKLSKGMDLLAIYRSSDWEKLLKLATLEALADEKSYNPNGGETYVGITSVHLERAKAFLDSLRPSEDSVIRSIPLQTKITLPTDLSFQSKIEQVTEILRAGSMTSYEVRRKCQWKDYEQVINTMLSSNTLKRVEKTTSKGYKKLHLELIQDRELEADPTARVVA